MRIVGLQELLSFPNGTLFAELREPFVFGDLLLKGDNLGGTTNDFWSKSLDCPDADDCGEAIHHLDAMLADPTVSYPADEAYSRGGYLGRDDYKFLVYEPADTRALIELLKESLMSGTRDAATRSESDRRTYMDNPPACGAPKNAPWGYLPCGCTNNGYGEHAR